jgi:hypothetical protein
MEYPIHHFQQLGFMELARADFIAQYEKDKHGMHEVIFIPNVYHANVRTYFVEIVRQFIKANDGPPFELVSRCLVVCPDIPKHSSDWFKFKDAVEEDAINVRRTFKCQSHLITL